MKIGSSDVLRVAFILLVSALLAGCTRAVPEFQIYVQAFNAQNEQADAALNVVGQAERTIVMRDIKPLRLDFDPNKAAYYLDNIDPPITGMVRNSIRSLKAYNDALGGLASGEAAEVLTGRIGTLTSNVTATIAASSVAIGGPSAVAGSAAFSGAVSTAMTAALPIFQQAATIASRESFRRQLVAGYPAMKQLVEGLRAGTPVMYRVMVQAAVVPGYFQDVSGIPPQNQAVLEKNRQILAGWVVLMDKTLVAMEAAVLAAMRDTSISDLAGLTEASVELRVLAEQMKSIRMKP